MDALPEYKYKSPFRLMLVAAAVILGLWFAKEIIGILFLFFLAIVLTLVLNAPTMWLIGKKISRTVAALLVFFALLLFLMLMGWLVIPRIVEQISSLISNLPGYFSHLQQQLNSWLHQYPAMQEKVLDNTSLQEQLPSASKLISSIGSFSFSLIGGIFIMIVFFSFVVYMLINPEPLIATYLFFFAKEKRQQATEALINASTMMVGWIWSNLVAGSIEAVIVFFFLSWMNVPGVWVWAALALFAEMVPKLGLYIMAVPPVLIALSVDPGTALWVLIFYLALNEVIGDFVLPRLRASTMKLHPVATLFMMLAMATAFGLVGALIATPLTAFIKAYYDAFYLPTVNKDHSKEQIRMILERKT